MHSKASIFAILSFFCFSSVFLCASQWKDEEDSPPIKDLVEEKKELYYGAKKERDARKNDSSPNFVPEKLGLKNLFGTNLKDKN